MTRFFTAADSREPELVGVWGGIVGSFYTLLITLALVMGGYAIAHNIHVNGPIAMAVAGLLLYAWARQTLRAHTGVGDIVCESQR